MQRSDPINSIDILIVEDHGILRESLSALLDSKPQMRVVGTAATGTEAVDAALRLRPQIVTMGLVLPVLNGFDATSRIHRALPDTRVIILSACNTCEHVFCALRAGACGYVLKQATVSELESAIITTLSGGRYLSPAIDNVRLDELLARAKPLSPLESLSDRERQVLHLTISGLSSARAGQLLHLSQKTVDTYRSRLMAKLGVSSITGLMHFAIANGLEPFMKPETPHRERLLKGTVTDS